MRRFLMLTFAFVACRAQSPSMYSPMHSAAIFAQIIAQNDNVWADLTNRSETKAANKTKDQRYMRILQRSERVCAKITGLERSVRRFEEIAKIVLTNAGDQRTESQIANFLDFIDEIDHAYGTLRNYTLDRTKMNPRTVVDFAQTATSHTDTSVKSRMEKVHTFIVPRTTIYKRHGLLHLFIDNKDLEEKIVRITGLSPNQLVYNLYNKIALTQIKANAIVQLSYQLLEVMQKEGTFGKEIDVFRERFSSNIFQMTLEVKKTMNALSMEYWRFDPEKFLKDRNYLEITKLAQGYLISENVLNRGRTCFGRCASYQEAKFVKCLDDDYCRKQRQCGSGIYHCRPLRNIDMSVCPALPNSSRRYNYIEYEDHKLIGQKSSSCPNETIKVNAWTGWCPYCMCLCDDEGVYSDRYFSMHRAASDLNRNRVVTGVRFVKRNRIIHLQVQQGKLLPYGVIDPDTVEWVPINNFRINDRYINRRQDFFKLDWGHRAVDLHVLRAEEEKNMTSVLTGVRFSDRNGHLNLEIRLTYFDFNSGKFHSGQSSTWKINAKSRYNTGSERRTKIQLNDLDISTQTKVENRVVSQGNQFVEFTATAFLKDAAQTTIPFIDAQDVAPTIPTALSGAGIYYKGIRGYGGFIGLKVVTYDFSRHFIRNK